MQFIVIRGIPVDEEALYIETYKEPLYTQIPKIYSKTDWPQIANVPCYMCTIITKRIPFFVPSVITATNEVHRGDHPVVCSPKCAMSWILDKAIDESEKRKYISYTIELLRQITGYTAKVIEPSLDKIELLKYGGNLTEHDYQCDLILSSGEYIKSLYSNISDYFMDIS